MAKAKSKWVIKNMSTNRVLKRRYSTSAAATLAASRMMKRGRLKNFNVLPIKK